MPMPTAEQLAGHGAVPGRRINAEGNDYVSHSGGETSATRWMDTALDMIDVTGMRVANGPRDPHTIINPQLVQTINGRQYTPRSNIHGTFSREGLWGNVNAPTATLAAIGLGAAFLPGLLGGEGLGGVPAETTGAFDVGGSTGFGGTVPLDAGVGAGTGGSVGAETSLDAIINPGAGEGVSYGAQTPFEFGPSTGSPIGAPDGTLGGGLSGGGGTGAFDAGQFNPSDLGVGPNDSGAFDIGGSTGFGGTTPLDTPWWQYITDPLANMVDNPMQYLDALSSVSKLPGIASALGGAGQQPGRTAGGSAPAAPGGGGGGAGARGAGKVDLLENPYAKAKVNAPGSLASYLRG